MGVAAIRVELSEPAPVEILEVGVGAGEREIDVIEHPSITGARLLWRSGHQPFGERGDRLGIGVVEERAMPIAVRMHVCGRWGSRRCGRRVGLSGRLGQQPGARNDPGPKSRTGQELATRHIMFAHNRLLRLCYIAGSLLDHLVRKVEHARRNSQAERLGGLQVDDQ